MMARRWAAATAVLCFALADGAMAQERRGSEDGTTPSLFIKLAQTTKFNNVVLAPQRYRVSTSLKSISLGDPQTMVVLVTMPAKQTAAPKKNGDDSATVTLSGQRVILTVRQAESVFTALGVLSAPVASAKVTLARKAEKAVHSNTSQPSDAQLVQDVAQRLTADLSGCAETALRAHWSTDDSRFETCVCPQLEKWRLPHVKKELRLHQFLVLNRCGFSYTVLPDGRVDACRVWMGSRPADDNSHDAKAMLPPVPPPEATPEPDKDAAGTPRPPSPDSAPPSDTQAPQNP